jgi:hypothetical protein
MPSQADFLALLQYPMETLSNEHKRWLDLRNSHGKGTLARAAIAIANHGGVQLFWEWMILNKA